MVESAVEGDSDGGVEGRKEEEEGEDEGVDKGDRMDAVGGEVEEERLLPSPEPLSEYEGENGWDDGGGDAADQESSEEEEVQLREMSLSSCYR